MGMKPIQAKEDRQGMRRVRGGDRLDDDGGRQGQHDAGGAKALGFAQRKAHHRGGESAHQQENDPQLKPLVFLEWRDLGGRQQLTRRAHRDDEEQAGEAQANTEDATSPARAEDPLWGGGFKFSTKLPLRLMERLHQQRGGDGR